MGATSVTGVSGPGSAARPGAGNKGSENMNLAVHRLIGPRVVMCGHATLDDGGHAVVYFPTLPGEVDQYCVFLSNGTDTHPYYGAFTTSSFGVTGAADDAVCWQVVKCGLWGSPTTDLANT